MSPGSDRIRAARALLALRPALAADGVALGIAAVGDPAARPAGPDERRRADTMPPARRRDFLAGRHAARRALAAAGQPSGEIGCAGRRPVPPAGTTVSISHSGGLAVALAAPAFPGRALGCDLELRGLPLPAAHLVLHPGEESWVRAAGGTAAAEARLLALFSAKEAAFKAYGVLLPAGRAPTTLLGITATPVPGGFLAQHRHRQPHRQERREGPGQALRIGLFPAGRGVFAWTAGVTARTAETIRPTSGAGSGWKWK
ncbi:4'-phosphopantetheinyl transferase superfamily protein [Streptomyces sp. NA02950]|nr:4'-phosphopantetheinyl transferase superfamily protein [Streptomyces sp. NA02950]